MKFQYKMPLGENTIAAPNAFATNIGKTIPVTLPNGDAEEGTVVAIDPSDDPHVMLVTVDVDSPELEEALRRPQPTLSNLDFHD